MRCMGGPSECFNTPSSRSLYVSRKVSTAEALHLIFNGQTFSGIKNV